MKELTEREAFNKAAVYCSRSEHCVSEVCEKLRQWGVSDVDMQQRIVHQLKEELYIDERRFCHAFVHDKVLYQGWGRMKIRAYLQAKRLPSTAIDSALANIDESEYYAVLSRVVTSKKRTIKSADPQAKEKLIRFCMQRGFTYDEIRACIDD
jgi:regulatory protein